MTLLTTSAPKPPAGTLERREMRLQSSCYMGWNDSVQGRDLLEEFGGESLKAFTELPLTVRQTKNQFPVTIPRRRYRAVAYAPCSCHRASQQKAFLPVTDFSGI